LTDSPEVEVRSADALLAWLEAHHGTSDGVRLVTWKAAHPDTYVSRDAVLDALLAYGWIDGRRFVVDAVRTAQLIPPRKQQAWSQSYKDRVEHLRAEGRMRPSGEAAVRCYKLIASQQVIYEGYPRLTGIDET